jgi:hypothetical protein
MHRKATDMTVIGIDIGKNTFHLVGLDERGAIVMRQKKPACDARSVHTLGHKHWVISGNGVTTASCPFFPQQQTSLGSVGTSAMCH